MAAADETPRAYVPLPENQVTRRRIAVVGGGLMGMSTAYAAARLGGATVSVDLYEANQIGHEGGASIDSTRLFRHAYGEWSHYTRWAAETLPLWRDLERQSGRTLYVKTGSVWAAHADNAAVIPSATARVFASEDPRAFIQNSEKTLTALGLPNEILDGAQYQRRFAQFANTGVVAAFLDINSGILFAREAVLALRDVAQRSGVCVHEAKRVLEVAPTPGGCGVRFGDGTSTEADVVVLAINGWLTDVLPGFPLVVTEQLMHYLVPDPAAASEFEPGRMPFCSWASNGMWVFPSCNGAVKIGDNYPSRTLRHPTERHMGDFILD